MEAADERGNQDGTDTLSGLVETIEVTVVCVTLGFGEPVKGKSLDGTVVGF